MKNLITVSESNQSAFEVICNELIGKGYILKSSSCGFVQSDHCNFCDCWMAIFIKEGTNEYSKNT